MNFNNVRFATFEHDFVLKKPTKSKIKLTELKQKLTDIGFYHTNNGNTTCFVCGFTTGNWELNSDPLNLSHPNCYWYECIKNAKNKAFDSPENLKLRLETFKNGWVGKDSIDSLHMASAGFHYDPSQDELDRVVCGVCSLVLEGWENGDVPFEEHSKRRPSCPFVKFLLEGEKSKNISQKKEIELVMHNLKAFNNSYTLQERSMTVEEFIRYQQEKARQEFIMESDRILEHLIAQGDSIF